MPMKDYMKSLPLIDTHMHRISHLREPDFGQIAGGALSGPNQPYHSRQRIMFGIFVDELRRRFSMPETATPLAVEEERARRVREDPHAYYKSCFEDAHVAMYCIETGAPLRSKAFLPDEVDFFDSCIPERQRSYILRIERFVDELLPAGLRFEEFERTLHEQLVAQIHVQCAVALKSAIAYYAGLNLHIPTREDAKAAYEKLLRKAHTAADERVFYTYTLMLGCEAAAECAIPLQIHTGPGNSIYFDHRSFNPALLTEFLRDKRVFNRITVVLLHAGHPYEEETGFLVSQYPNVYTDLSQTFLFSSLMAKEKIRALFEYAPLDKIMYGSDGVLFPEMYWYAPRRFRELLADVLISLTEEHFISGSRAKDVAKAISYDNALACYTKLRDML